MTGHYLAHLAELGTTNRHPSGRQATWRLIATLELLPGQRVLEIGWGTGGTMVLAKPESSARVKQGEE